MKYLKVENDPGLIRDTEVGSVLSVDNEGLAAYKLKKKKSQEVNKIFDDINMLKLEMKEIKTLLTSLIKE